MAKKKSRLDFMEMKKKGEQVAWSPLMIFLWLLLLNRPVWI